MPIQTVGDFESYLAGHRDSAAPGATISGILFLVCCGLTVSWTA